MSETNAAESGQDNNVASTNGWDTVAAITYTEVNKALAASGTYPKSFSQEADDKSASVSGKFAGWSVTTGGSGPLIHMSLVVTDGTFTAEGETTKSFEGTLKIELRSEFIPQPGKPTALDLSISTKSPVSATKEDFKGLSRLYRGAAKDLIGIWLNKNVNEFNNVFATVNLDKALVKDGIAWLAPSFQGYAVAEPMQSATLDNSVFGVMCLIGGDQPGAGLAEQISPFAIPAGHKAGFLISQRKFLEHIILAGLGFLFKDLKDKDLHTVFEVTNNGTRIQNKQRLTMLDYKLGNDTVAPIVEAGQFQLDCAATELRLSILDMWFDVPLFGVIHDALTAKLNYTGRYRLRLDDTGHLLALDIIKESSSASVVSSSAWTIVQIVLGSLSVLACVTGGGFMIAGRVAAAGAAASGTVLAAGEVASLGAVETGEVIGTVVEDTIATAVEAVTTGSTQSVGAIGINCAAAVRVSFAVAGALGFAPSIGMIQQAVANRDVAKIPPIRNLIDQGLAKVVQFPSTLGTLTLASAGLNESLQLGMK